MQEEYCDLWDELLQKVQDSSHPHTPIIARDILRHLRKNHIALHKSTDASLFYASTDNNSYDFCGIRNHITTTNPTIPRSSRSLLSETDPNPPNVVTGATEVTGDASNISPLANTGAPTPTIPCLPLAIQPSVENPPSVQENHGQTKSPHFDVIDSSLLTSLDVSVVQSVQTSPNLGLPSLPSDAGPSSAIPNAIIPSPS